MPRLSFQHFTARIALVALGGWAATNAVMTGALGMQHQPDAPALGLQMHDYIVAHPEVITEAQQKLAVKQAADRQSQAKKVLADNHNAVL